MTTTPDPVLDSILERARAAPARIALPEANDARILEGALRAKRDGLAHPILLGDAGAVAKDLAALGAAADELEIVDAASSSKLEAYAGRLHELRGHKGMDLDAAREAILDPLTQAAMMVREGDADGTVAGAIATTADTVRAAFQVIGRAEGVKSVSSYFLMIAPDPDHPAGPVLVFADCALTIQPDAAALAQIALSTADSCRAMLGTEPRVAMLSFSTAGSARHERVRLVTAARDLVREARPDLVMDGELQFDAAIVPDVAVRKAPESSIEGRANVCVFPSLEAANIGYKIAQRLGGFTAIGPVLQGLAKPANDLSRGCSVDDVVTLLAVTSVQAAARAG